MISKEEQMLNGWKEHFEVFSLDEPESERKITQAKKDIVRY